MVRLVTSLHDGAGSERVVSSYVTSQEKVPLAVTTNVVLLVLKVLPEAALVTVVAAGEKTADPPLLPQVPSLYRTNVSVPLRLASPVGVAGSLGFQSWAVERPDVPVTMTSSVDSGQAPGPAPRVFGLLPL